MGYDNRTFAYSAIPASPAYNFQGFFAPIDNAPVVNVAMAGRTIPVKWRVTDADGNPIGDPAHFVSVTTGSDTCSSSDPTDTVETYTPASGLQFLGNGNWQFNWAVPKSTRTSSRS